MGRTVPPWRIVVNAEMERLRKFGQFLRAEDRAVFDDLLNQCKNYASEAGAMTSVVKEVPLMMSMLFAHHKKLWELEKRLAKSREMKP